MNLKSAGEMSQGIDEYADRQYHTNGNPDYGANHT
jgi:hypothetical protein